MAAAPASIGQDRDHVSHGAVGHRTAVHETTDGGAVRVDVWLWAVRATKTRSAATAACRAGHVRVDDDRVKAAHRLRVGDVVRLRVHGFDRVLRVRATIAKRVGAEAAAGAVEDLTPPPPEAQRLVVLPRRERGAGRPTKRERRELDRLRGREAQED